MFLRALQQLMIGSSDDLASLPVLHFPPDSPRLTIVLVVRCRHSRVMSPAHTCVSP